MKKLTKFNDVRQAGLVVMEEQLQELSMNLFVLRSPITSASLNPADCKKHLSFDAFFFHDDRELGAADASRIANEKNLFFEVTSLTNNVHTNDKETQQKKCHKINFHFYRILLRRKRFAEMTFDESSY